MSAKERDRLQVLAQIREGYLSQKRGAELLGLSTRQLRRVQRRYEREGDSGLVHRLRGRVSNRKTRPEIEARAKELLEEEYSGFGPTLASEKLEERDGIRVSRETVRRWMIEVDEWHPRRQRVHAREHRPRRECFGELVQMDTSEHDWFEGRGKAPVLIGLIDDATSRFHARMYESDTSRANREMLRDWIRRHGRPVALYADGASHFVTSRRSSVDEELAGRESETQIGRALRELEIEYIRAHSPEAKGRVERCFGTCQDRLVKELRLAGIATIEEANAYLEEVFLPLWNRRFAVSPASQVDAHRSVDGFDLEAALSRQKARVVTNDYTVGYEKQVYQIQRRSVTAGLRGSRVTVEERLDGRIRLRWRGGYLKHRQVGEPKPAGTSVGLRPPSVPAQGPKPKRKVSGWKPAPDHPWRQYPNRTLPSCTEADIPTLR